MPSQATEIRSDEVPVALCTTVPVQASRTEAAQAWDRDGPADRASAGTPLGGARVQPAPVAAGQLRVAAGVASSCPGQTTSESTGGVVVHHCAR